MVEVMVVIAVTGLAVVNGEFHSAAVLEKIEEGEEEEIVIFCENCNWRLSSGRRETRKKENCILFQFHGLIPIQPI